MRKSELLHALQHVAAILALFLFGTSAKATTIVMMLFKGDRVIVAADGIQTGKSMDGRVRFHRETCKIRTVNDVQISIAGLAELPASAGYNPDHEARKIFSSRGTFKERVDRLDPILARETARALAFLRTNVPSEYKKVSQPGEHSVEVLIVGYEQSSIVYAILSYELRSNGTIKNNVEIVPQDQQVSGLHVFGHSDRIHIEVNKTDFEASLVANPANTLKNLIEMEYDGNEVGPPIAISEFKKGRVTWIEPGACEAK
jgi:hypothetical protein